MHGLIGISMFLVSMPLADLFIGPLVMVVMVMSKGYICAPLIPPPLTHTHTHFTVVDHLGTPQLDMTELDLGAGHGG